MATLHEMLEFVRRCAAESGQCISEELARDLEKRIRQQWPSERIYISPVHSRMDPARGEAIRQAAKHLPTSVIVARYGISRQLVAYHTRKRKTPAAG